MLKLGTIPKRFEKIFEFSFFVIPDTKNEWVVCSIYIRPGFIHTLQRNWSFPLRISWRRPLSCRNQSIDLPHKSMDWFLYDNGLRHERVKDFISKCDLRLAVRFCYGLIEKRVFTILISKFCFLFFLINIGYYP